MHCPFWQNWIIDVSFGVAYVFKGKTRGEGWTGWPGLRWGGCGVATGWQNFGHLFGIGLDLACIFEMAWP